MILIMDARFLLINYHHPPALLVLLAMVLSATSHTRLRARDHFISCALIGGKGGARPSLLHTMLEGPT